MLNSHVGCERYLSVSLFGIRTSLVCLLCQAWRELCAYIATHSHTHTHSLTRIHTHTHTHTHSLTFTHTPVQLVCRSWQPERLAPETAKNPYDVRSDVWAFGLTMYELACLKYPYSEDDSHVYIRMKQIVECKQLLLGSGDG